MAVRFPIAVMVAAFVALLTPVAAHSASASQLDDCFSPSDTLVETDGSIYVAGTSGPSCEWNSSGNFPGRQVAVVGLDSDGSVDQGFSEGGLRTFDTGTSTSVPVALMNSAAGNVVLATSSGLYRFGLDGVPDPGFGDAGKVRVYPQVIGKPVSAAALQPNGKTVVVGGQKYGGVYVARFNVNGSLDDSFGGDGIVKPAVPEGASSFSDIASLAFDENGRIVLGGFGYQEAEVMRLLADGSLDPGFGPDHDGFTTGPTPYDSSHGPHVARPGPVFVQENGNIRIYATGVIDTYSFFDFMTEFDEDGKLVGDGPQIVGSSSLAFAETPDGSIAESSGPGRGSPPHFNIVKHGLAGSPGFDEKTFSLTPDISRTTSISYSPFDDTIIAAGYAYGINCVAACQDRSFGAVAKVDADTGEPVMGFGVNGSVLIPKNECAYGDAPAPAGLPDLAWDRCAVKPPRLSGKVRVMGTRTRSPSVRGTINVEGAQERPYFLNQTVTVRLPDRLKLRAGKVRSRLAAEVSTGQPGTAGVSLDRGRIRIRFRPDSSQYDYFQGSFGEVDPANEPIRIDLRLRKGALKKIPGRLRKKSLNFMVKATYEPIDLKATRVAPSPWFAPGSSKWVAVPASSPGA